MKRPGFWLILAVVSVIAGLAAWHYFPEAFSIVYEKSGTGTIYLHTVLGIRRIDATGRISPLFEDRAPGKNQIGSYLVHGIDQRSRLRFAARQADLDACEGKTGLDRDPIAEGKVAGVGGGTGL